MMKDTEIVKHLTPCGLDCERCADFKDGEIRSLSVRLLELLGNYERVAKLKAPQKPEFSQYTGFLNILKSFAEGTCSGCRSKNVDCPINCPFEKCRDKGIDFCYQCQDYPCDAVQNTGFGNFLQQRNNRMKEIGIAGYYKERLKLPRYP